MIFNGMDMNQILGKAKELQEQYKKQQEANKDKKVYSSVGGGMVNVEMNASMEITQISIEKDVVDPEDLETLQDLIIAGVNEAIKKAKELQGGGLADMMKDFQMPDLGGFDFSQFKK